MSDAPRISVVVPFRNAAATLDGLLRGLASQRATTLGDAEFVFVNNASEDDGADLIAAFALPGATILREEKRGVSAARNRGVAVARGEVIAIVDSDCIPSRQWLRELVAPFVDADTHLVAGSLASYPPQTGAQRFAARYGMNDGRRTLDMALPFANGRNMAVRRSSALAIGGWSEDLLQGDDIDFSTRLIGRFGCAIEYREHALVYHRDRESDEELWKQAEAYGRGVAAVYDRYPERLPWGAPQRVARARIAARRRFGAAAATVGQRIGMTSTDDAEFARYLNGWDRRFWRGFHTERRRLREAG
jgi:cellulose synthase/poly-beta-1,6-N-acetylglucosamine synthase-like glycosyltransferase